jgi:hypothetical protein
MLTWTTVVTAGAAGTTRVTAGAAWTSRVTKGPACKICNFNINSFFFLIELNYFFRF